MAPRHFFASAEQCPQRRRAPRESRPVAKDRADTRTDGLQLVRTDRPLLSSAQVAKRLGVSVWTVGRLLKHQGLPYIVVGRCRRFDQDELERWIDERRQRHDAQAALALVSAR